MNWPSGEKNGSVSMPEELMSRRTPLPSGLTVNICEPPSRDRATASREPSGAQAGALLEPLKFAATWRCPLCSEWT